MTFADVEILGLETTCALIGCRRAGSEVTAVLAIPRQGEPQNGSCQVSRFPPPPRGHVRAGRSREPPPYANRTTKGPPGGGGGAGGQRGGAGAEPEPGGARHSRWPPGSKSGPTRPPGSAPCGSLGRCGLQPARGQEDAEESFPLPLGQSPVRARVSAVLGKMRLPPKQSG